MAQEVRIEKLEECDCTKSCKFNNSILEDGYEWDVNCTTYKCVRGVIQSGPKKCAELGCKNPVQHNGSCCPVCLSKCTLFCKIKMK